MAHVLESVEPALATQLNSFGPDMVSAMSTGRKADSRVTLQQQLNQRALLDYAKRLAERCGHKLDAGDTAHLRDLDAIAEKYDASFDTAIGRHRAFGAVASFLRDRFNWSVEPEVEAECRSLSLQHCGLDAFGEPVQPAVANDILTRHPAVRHSPQRAESITADSKERYLDSEIVAISW